MQMVSFTRMEDGTREDYELLDRLEHQYIEQLPDRILDALAKLEYSLSGYRTNRLEHSLQSATRAHRDGREEEYVIAALLHDIGDELAPHSHSEMAAAILRPYVSEKIYWIIKHHGVFQMFYFAHHCGGDRNTREIYKQHQWYDDAVEFCHLYDQNCFDPDYASEPLSFFEPMLRRVLKTPRLDDAEHLARYGNTG